VNTGGHRLRLVTSHASREGERRIDEPVDRVASGLVLGVLTAAGAKRSADLPPSAGCADRAAVLAAASLVVIFAALAVVPFCGAGAPRLSRGSGPSPRKALGRGGRNRRRSTPPEPRAPPPPDCWHEIVQVNLKTTTAAARSWVVFGDHWPSRRGVSSAGPPGRLLGLPLITAGAAASRRSDERS
jgi:hypothetical protein